MRSGVIAKKLGMTRLFLEDGRQVPVTVLHLDNVQVVAQRTAERDGYTAVQLGAGAAKAKRRHRADARPLRQGAGRAQAQDRRVPGRPRQPDRASARRSPPTTTSPVSSSTSPAPRSARASPGAMKRHNFGGLRAVARRVGHRTARHGSTGQCQDPGKVFKGKKMAGHMGAVRVDHAEPAGRAHRQRPRPDHGQGRGPGLQGRLGHDQGRGQEGRARERDPAGGAALGRARPRTPPPKAADGSRRRRGRGRSGSALAEQAAAEEAALAQAQAEIKAGDAAAKPSRRRGDDADALREGRATSNEDPT